MPFKSKAQMRYLYSQEPEVAKDFAKKTSKEQYKKMPEKVKQLAHRMAKKASK